MPVLINTKKLPPASKRKRLLHAFYLAQPFLQFFALMAVLFVLGRCSPLSPSTDRSVVRSFSDNGVKATEQSLTQAEELDINNSLQDISDLSSIAVISQSQFADLTAESVHADQGADEARVKQVFGRRGPRAHLLVLPLLSSEYDKFFREGSARADLAQRLGQLDGQVRKLYFSELNRAANKNAKVVLVVADAAMQKIGNIRSLPIQAKVRLGFPKEDRAYIQLSRQNQQPLEERDAALIHAVLAQQPKLAVVLE